MSLGATFARGVVGHGKGGGKLRSSTAWILVAHDTHVAPTMASDIQPFCDFGKGSKLPGFTLGAGFKNDMPAFIDLQIDELRQMRRSPDIFSVSTAYAWAC